MQRQRPQSKFMIGLLFTLGTIVQVPSYAQNCADPDQEPLPISLRQNVKFFSGHYVYVGDNTPTQLEVALEEIENIDSMEGVLKRYPWSFLEVSKDDYSGIKRIKEDLAKAQAKGKKLAIFIQTKFMTKDKNNRNPMPNYLKDLTSNDYYYKIGGGANQGPFAKGFLAKLENPIVVKRMVKLMQELREQLDHEQALAAVVFGETAHGIKAQPINENAYYDGLMQVDRAAACYFRKTPVIQLTNFPLKKVKDLFIPTYTKYGIGFGGADVLINDASLNRSTYSHYPTYSNKLPIGFIVAGSNFEYDNHESFRKKVKASDATNYSLRIDKLARFADVNLKSNFVFWRREWAKDEYYLQILDKAKKKKLPVLNARCPSIYDCQK